MTNQYGGDQLVRDANGQWTYANPFDTGGGQDMGNGMVFTPNPNPISRYDQSGTISFGGVQIGTRDTSGADHYLPSTLLDMMFGTGGGSTRATWRPGEYGLQQQQNDMLQQHYYITDTIAALTQQQTVLNDQRTNAINEGNLALSRQIEQRMAANEAQKAALAQQQQAIDAAIGQANALTSAYATQTQGRSSQLGTLATLTQNAAEAQANPWNPMGYLTNVASGGGATPYSNMTAGQNTAYGNQMAQNWQNTYGNVYDTLNQSIAQTYQTPQSILDAIQKMVPMQTPAAQTPTQIALARYGASTEGEKAALAAASPEALKRLWEAGQVR